MTKSNLFSIGYYATSKQDPEREDDVAMCYGYRGQALANLSCIAQLFITSWHTSESIPVTVKLMHAKTMQINKVAFLKSYGTRVQVTALFYNCLVRQRILHQIPRTRHIASTIYHIVAYSLRHCNVRFTLWDKSTEDCLLDIPTGTMPQRLRNIYGKNIGQLFFERVRKYSDNVVLTGWLSWSRWTVKTIQYIYINQYWLRNEYDCRAIIKDLNANCTRKMYKQMLKMLQLDVVYKSHDLLKGQLSFIFIFNCQPSENYYDRISESCKQLNILRKAVNQLVDEFLQLDTGVIRHAILGNNTTNPILPVYNQERTIQMVDSVAINENRTTNLLITPTTTTANSISWYHQLFKTWIDPVFPIPEMFIYDCNTKVISNNYSGSLALPAAMADSCLVQLPHQSLRAIQVLSQIDNKFIAGLMPIPHCQTGSANSTLVVLVDQHAAHERILLEWLQDQYIAISKGILDGFECDMQQFVVPLSHQEQVMAKERLVELAYWGVVIHLSIDHQDHSTARIPTMIYEHYMHNPCILARLVQDCIHELAAQPSCSHIVACPSSIQNALKEMACKRAIKFNDPLDYQSCCRLMKLLGRCRHPFQCAHGRPSIVPLIKLSRSSAIISNSYNYKLIYYHNSDKWLILLNK
ncbi:hypothetical protein BDF19DRAFT_499316 [Syncephalis fuscata]|nr:hypothetical protein BDF19DRAFT_499316 [Syncephalis fuscata]